MKNSWGAERTLLTARMHDAEVKVSEAEFDGQGRESMNCSQLDYTGLSSTDQSGKISKEI